MGLPAIIIAIATATVSIAKTVTEIKSYSKEKKGNKEASQYVNFSKNKKY